MNVLELEQALLEVDSVAVTNIISSISMQQDAMTIIEKMIVPALDRIGVGWEKGDVALSQVYMSGRIVERIVDELLPSTDPNRKNQPKMAIATLQDYHLLGKRIIYSTLRASGYALLDFGRTTVDELVELIIKESIELVLISTLMLPSALEVKDLRAKLDAKGVKPVIIVGGAPFRLDDNLYKEVGADATAVNAKKTVALIESLLGGSDE